MKDPKEQVRSAIAPIIQGFIQDRGAEPFSSDPILLEDQLLPLVTGLADLFHLMAQSATLRDRANILWAFSNVLKDFPLNIDLNPIIGNDRKSKEGSSPQPGFVEEGHVNLG